MMGVEKVVLLLWVVTCVAAEREQRIGSGSRRRHKGMMMRIDEDDDGSGSGSTKKSRSGSGASGKATTTSAPATTTSAPATTAAPKPRSINMYEGEDCSPLINTVLKQPGYPDDWNIWPPSDCRKNDDRKGPGENHGCINGKCACFTTQEYTPNATAMLCIKPRCEVLTSLIQQRKQCLVDKVEEKVTKDIVVCIIGVQKDCKAGRPPSTARFMTRGTKLSGLKVQGTLEASSDSDYGSDESGESGVGPPSDEGEEGWRYVVHYSFCSKEYGVNGLEAYGDYRAMAKDLEMDLLFWANPDNNDDDRLSGYPSPCTKEQYEGHEGPKDVLEWLDPTLTITICPKEGDCDNATSLEAGLNNSVYILDYPTVALPSLPNGTSYSG